MGRNDHASSRPIPPTCILPPCTVQAIATINNDTTGRNAADRDGVKSHKLRPFSEHEDQISATTCIQGRWRIVPRRENRARIIRGTRVINSHRRTLKLDIAGYREGRKVSNVVRSGLEGGIKDANSGPEKTIMATITREFNHSRPRTHIYRIDFPQKAPTGVPHTQFACACRKSSDVLGQNRRRTFSPDIEIRRSARPTLTPGRYAPFKRDAWHCWPVMRIPPSGDPALPGGRRQRACLRATAALRFGWRQALRRLSAKIAGSSSSPSPPSLRLLATFCAPAEPVRSCYSFAGLATHELYADREQIVITQKATGITTDVRTQTRK
jgi:hypothetical protein